MPSCALYVYRDVARAAELHDTCLSLCKTLGRLHVACWCIQVIVVEMVVVVVAVVAVVVVVVVEMVVVVVVVVAVAAVVTIKEAMR